MASPEFAGSAGAEFSKQLNDICILGKVLEDDLLDPEPVMYFTDFSECNDPCEDFPWAVLLLILLFIPIWGSYAPATKPPPTNGASSRPPPMLSDGICNPNEADYGMSSSDRGGQDSGGQRNSEGPGGEQSNSGGRDSGGQTDDSGESVFARVALGIAVFFTKLTTWLYQMWEQKAIEYIVEWDDSDNDLEGYAFHVFIMGVKRIVSIDMESADEFSSGGLTIGNLVKRNTSYDENTEVTKTVLCEKRRTISRVMKGDCFVTVMSKVEGTKGGQRGTRIISHGVYLNDWQNPPGACLPRKKIMKLNSGIKWSNLSEVFEPDDDTESSPVPDFLPTVWERVTRPFRNGIPGSVAFIERSS